VTDTPFAPLSTAREALRLLALQASGAIPWEWTFTHWEQTPLDAVHPDDVAELQEAVKAHLHGDSDRFTLDLRVRGAQDTWSWVACCGAVVDRKPDGQALTLMGTCTDISARKQQDLALHEQSRSVNRVKQLLQTTLISIDLGVLALDGGLRIIQFNPRVCELLDVPSQFLARHPTLRELTTYQRARGDFGVNGALGEPQARDFLSSDGNPVAPAHYLRKTRDGRTLEVKTRLIPGGGMVRTFADVTNLVVAEAGHRQAQAAMQASDERWKLALESTGDGVWDWHIESKHEFFSKRLLQMCGFEEDDLRNHPQALDDRTHPDDMEQLRRDRQAHFDGLVPTYQNEHRILCKDGTWKWVLSRGMVISRDPQGKPLRMIGTFTDVTPRREADALIRQQAFFDTLTGLPNRRMMRDRLDQDIKKCKRDRQELALLFIDLDHFKEVNDTLGHDYGDLLLIEAGRRIQACVRESDTVSRIGGDEFTVVLTELDSTSHLEGILQKILWSMEAVFQLGAEQVFVSASIGITMYPADATEIEGLFKSADQALYVAKGAGRNRFSFFTSALQDAAQTRVRLTSDLRVALTDQQFRVVFQPIVDLSNGAIHKAEALIRWQHPTRGLVSPASFIPIAEASGLIVDIGEWVFGQAMQQVGIWRSTLHPDFQISVNKSPVQFHHADLGRAPWALQLQAQGLPGSCIVVEITEGLLLDTGDSIGEQLLQLGDAGIQVSLDDFGTGYSSLSYLQKYDIDFVKIDQSFVRNLIADSTDLALCKAIIVMAHALGMKVIAEGVETETQRNLLAAAGCDYAQGYFYARPMPAADFEAFMKNYKRMPV
jgi:diguanylate cyclase (GGDEF)-like protein/PAS domain S-box-containing protein